jgi:hypothetical protein
MRGGVKVFHPSSFSSTSFKNSSFIYAATVTGSLLALASEGVLLSQRRPYVLGRNHPYKKPKAQPLRIL